MGSYWEITIHIRGKMSKTVTFRVWMVFYITVARHLSFVVRATIFVFNITGIFSTSSFTSLIAKFCMFFSLLIHSPVVCAAYMNFFFHLCHLTKFTIRLYHFPICPFIYVTSVRLYYVFFCSLIWKDSISRSSFMSLLASFSYITHDAHRPFVGVTI